MDIDSSLLGKKVAQKFHSQFNFEAKEEASSTYSVEELTRKIFSWGEKKDSNLIIEQIEIFCKTMKKEFMNVEEGYFFFYLFLFFILFLNLFI